MRVTDLTRAMLVDAREEARLLTPSERRSMERVTREIHAEVAKLLKDYQPLWMWEPPHCDSALSESENRPVGMMRKR